MESDGHIDRFFTHADFQGRGVGTAMMLALVEKTRRSGCLRVFAEVSITALPFFERQGFVTLAEQQVEIRGATLINYRVELNLTTASR